MPSLASLTLSLHFLITYGHMGRTPPTTLALVQERNKQTKKPSL